MRVAFAKHGLSDEDAAAVAEVIASAIITTGSVGRTVEAQLGRYFGRENAVLFSSWTNGAVATLLALGIGPGDEVVVPAMTFVGSAHVVELVGAKAVLADVDPATQLMTAETLVPHLSDRTKAVIPVHLYGQMVDIPALKVAIGARPIAIIEDCAHCFEGTLRGERPGTHSTAALFSFYATKNVTCGEGGAAITDDAALAAAIRRASAHGRRVGVANGFRTGTHADWDVAELGTKANLPDLLAALLPRQIDLVGERREQRAGIAQHYRDGLTGTPIRSLSAVEDCVSAHHMFPVSVPPALRDRVIEELRAAGVEVTVAYRALTSLSYYRNRYGLSEADTPNAAFWGQSTIALPIYPALRSDQQDFVIEMLLSIVGRHTRGCGPVTGYQSRVA